MDIKEQVDILSKERNLVLKVIDGLTLSQINHIPTGHKNNIGWNVAHMVVTQQLLCYKLSGLAPKISNEMIESYKKGSKTDRIIDQTEWNLIKELFTKLPQDLLKDYQEGIFKDYENYETSVAVVLDHIDKAIAFNNFHEGIHLGVILSQKKEC